MLAKDSVSRIEHPESSIQDRGSRLCLCALVAERLPFRSTIKWSLCQGGFGEDES
ncbi:MAG: hypothetical protein AB1797_04525 [bacterium]